MKILILTVSAGEGHNSMCRALTNYFNENYNDVEIKQIDLFKDGEQTKEKKKANWYVTKGYFYSVKYLFNYANKVFRKLRDRDVTKEAPTLRKNFISPSKKFVENIINDFKPDAVFCAHTFAGIILSDLRKEHNENALKARVVSVVSDFDIAPYTEFLTEVDYIVTPSDDFDKDLEKRGFDLSKRISLGIPFQTKFNKEIDKNEAKKQLGLKLDKKTVLVMSGGIGFGNLKNTILNLNKCKSDFQIVCICGKNQAMKNTLDKLKASKKIKKDILILGFVNNVDVIMSACDVLLGKLGGLSTMEAFNKNLPIIAYNHLHFQEYDNMMYLKSKNTCEYITNSKKTYQFVDNFFLDKEKANNMIKAIKEFRKPNATKDICSLLYKGV